MFFYYALRSAGVVYCFSVLLPIITLLANAASLTTQAATKTARLIHQFPNGTWVENIATLNSGLILVTLLNSADIVLLDPQKPQDPIVVYHETNNTAVLGIAVLGVSQPDPSALVVVYGNISAPGQPSTPGSFGINLFSLQSNGSVTYKASFPVPGAQNLDGLTALPVSSRYVLAADSVLGVVWRVDLETGVSEKAFTSSLLQRSPNTSLAGVNGIRAQDDYLYFTNSNTATFGRIAMTTAGLPVNQHNAATIIVHDFDKARYDDFALGPEGSDTFYLCSPTGFSINKVDSLSGRQTVFAGGANDTTLGHPVGAMLGKTRADSHVLYVTTAGGQVFAVDIDN